MGDINNATWKFLEGIRNSLNEVVDKAIASAERNATENQDVYPPIDLTEKNGQYLVTIETPGMLREDLSLSIEGNVLAIRGNKLCSHSSSDGAILRTECVCGPFRRTLVLPGPVEPESILASYYQGVLTVCVSKAAVAEPRSIDINDGTPKLHGPLQQG
mgnify:CR=1 FL=1